MKLPGRHWLVIAAAALVASMGTASAAPSAVPAQTHQPIKWLAAGDSYSSGEGLPHSTGPCAQALQGSGSTTWAQQAYQDLQIHGTSLTQPVLVACTGATTPNMISTPDGGGFPEWVPSDGQFDLVTMTFGGDNIDFAPVLEQCIGLSRLIANGEDSVTSPLRVVAPLPSDPGHTCPKASILEGRIATMGAGYPSFLSSVANRIVTKGGNIVVLGYPELVEVPKFWHWWEQKVGACWGIGTADATELRGLAGDLNATIGQAVATFNRSAPNGVHATFVDVNTANGPTASDDPDLFEPSSGTRHNLCSADPWLNGWTTIHHGFGSFHPKQQGLDHEAELAAVAIEDLNWSGLGGSTTTTPTPPPVSVPTPVQSSAPPSDSSMAPTCAEWKAMSPEDEMAAIQAMQQAHGDTSSIGTATISIELFCKVYPTYRIDGIYNGNL